MPKPPDAVMLFSETRINSQTPRHRFTSLVTGKSMSLTFGWRYKRLETILKQNNTYWGIQSTVHGYSIILILFIKLTHTIYIYMFTQRFFVVLALFYLYDVSPCFIVLPWLPVDSEKACKTMCICSYTKGCYVFSFRSHMVSCYSLIYFWPT